MHVEIFMHAPTLISDISSRKGQPSNGRYGEDVFHGLKNAMVDIYTLGGIFIQ